MENRNLLSYSIHHDLLLKIISIIEHAYDEPNPNIKDKQTIRNKYTKKLSPQYTYM